MAKTKKEKEKPKTTGVSKEEILESTLKNLQKAFGDGIVMRKNSPLPDIELIPSGSIGLDKALGGGYAKGRIIEIFGPESSGKTTLALHAIAEVQKMGGIAAFIDAEHALDAGYATNLGVNMQDLVFSQPDSGEQVLNVADQLVRSGALDLIVIDSVSALVPKAELEGEVGQSHMGGQARLMSQAMRMLVGSASKAGTAIIFINQIRMKIGVMFGNPETTSGGNALKFYTSQRVDIRRTGVIGESDNRTGITTRIKVAKNKVARPFRAVELSILFGQGIDWAQDLVDQATISGVLSKNGAWYKYGEEQFAHGAAAAAEKLRQQPELVEELRIKVMAV
jgi:recombination protein RecA